MDKSGQVNKKLEPGVLKQMNIVSELTQATLRSSPKSGGFIPTLKFSIIFFNSVDAILEATWNLFTRFATIVLDGPNTGGSGQERFLTNNNNNKKSTDSLVSKLMYRGKVWIIVESEPFIASALLQP